VPVFSYCDRTEHAPTNRSSRRCDHRTHSHGRQSDRTRPARVGDRAVRRVAGRERCLEFCRLV